MTIMGGGLTKVQPYAIISLDLTTARTDTAEGAITIDGVATENWIANTLTVISLGGGSLSLKLNSSDAGSMSGIADGFKVEGIPFTEIFWTNIAQAGLTAIVMIGYVE